MLIQEFSNSYPEAFDRTTKAGTPADSRVLNFREEPDSEEGSSPDEGLLEKGSGHRGIGHPMMVGVGYTQRELCDGQSLASPGRWPPGSRVYPTSQPWIQIAECYARFADHYGTETLLVSLASGKVTECPFPAEEISILNRELLGIASQHGFQTNGKPGDRTDVPINFRFLQMPLRIADDPEIGLGDYSQGVRVGPGTRMPRLPAFFRPKKKWRLASQVDPLDYLEGSTDSTTVWRMNYWTLQPLEQQVLDVVHYQATRSQVLVLSEMEAKLRYPDLVIASLGAQRKEKPGGKITARVLFDGTHGLSVNSRTRIRDQERAPNAADLKRTMREKAKVDELTFALSADVTEAHRQVPIHPDDWHLLGCQVIPGGDVFVNTVGTFGVASVSYYWSRVAAAVGRLAQYLAGDYCTTWHMLVADGYLLECGGRYYRRGLVLFFVLCASLGVPLAWHKTAGGDE